MGHKQNHSYKGYSSYKQDEDFVLVDFETPSVPDSGDTVGFIDFLPGANFSQKGFEIQSFINGSDASEEQDEILYNKNAAGSLISSAIAALEAFDITGKYGQDNQGLAPNFFTGDLEVIYFEKDKWNEPKEREDFRFKGLFASGIGATEALANVTLTFIGYRDGDKEFEFTKTVESGGFIKSDYRDKIDRLVITDGDPLNDFVIDNFMAEV
jgi:hypothetical protein